MRRVACVAYATYIVWCAASVALLVSLLLAENCQSDDTGDRSDRRRLLQKSRSAFSLLTNSTPAANDLIVAIRCDMVHQDTTFDICNPSSVQPAPTTSIVQRDAMSYDLEMTRLCTSDDAVAETTSETTPETTPETAPETAPESTSGVLLQHGSAIAETLIAMSLMSTFLIFAQTIAIAVSESYYCRIVNGPPLSVTLLRIVLASITLLVCVLGVWTACPSERPLLALWGAVVYVGCLAEACVWGSDALLGSH